MAGSSSGKAWGCSKGQEAIQSGAEEEINAGLHPWAFSEGSVRDPLPIWHRTNDCIHQQTNPPKDESRKSRGRCVPGHNQA
jgi:hypothetical protein